MARSQAWPTDAEAGAPTASDRSGARVKAPARRSLTDVVAEEMRAAVMMLPREELPQAAPHDLDAEQEILSALLCDHVTTDELKPLTPQHFYSRFNQFLYQVLLNVPERDLQKLTDLLDVRGPVLEELTTIRDATPFCSLQTLRKHVATLVERSLERELIRVMQKIDAELRVGSLARDEARIRLRKHFTGSDR